MPPGPPPGAFVAFLVTVMGEAAAQTWLRWFQAEHPDWARQGWQRLDAARDKVRCPP